jgi:uncharacterized membrane protein YgaE (UPF0421/DUF939 family)
MMWGHGSSAALQMSVRAAAAAGIAVFAAELMALDFPLYAMIAAVIVTDLSPTRTRELALPRLISTALGGLLGAIFASLGWHGLVAVTPAILVTMFVAHVLRAPDAGRLAGYVCGIVVLAYHADAWWYALFRWIETALGIAVAVAVSLVPKMMQERRPTDA